MIVKFHARGTGCGAGPVDYLLGRSRDREDAYLLRGDPDQTAALIDSSRYAKGYTSGVLSFLEEDLPHEDKQAIMDDFERVLLPGLEADQYDCLWVEHRDKGRLELNFVVPNLELTTGKRLQPYFDAADRPRIDAWKVITNATYALHDPDDPANQRALTYPSTLPRDRLEAQQAITLGLLQLAGRGEVRTRRDVVSALEDVGFEVTRETKSSISVADPEGGRPIRLRGRLYEQDFGLGAGLRGEIEAASRAYRASAEKRVREARSRLEVGLERKHAENERRYTRPQHAYEPFAADQLEMGRDSRDRASVAAHGRDMGARSVHPEPDTGDQRQSGDVGRAGPQGWEAGFQSLQKRRQQPDVYRDRSENGAIRRRTSHVHDTEGVLNDDGFRARAARRLRAIGERLYRAASGVGERLRGFATHVRHYTAGQRETSSACDALESASRTLERGYIELAARHEKAIALERQQYVRTHDRGGYDMGM